MSNIYTEQFFEVIDQQLKVSIRVGPDDDIGELVQLTTVNKFSKEHFGDLRLVMEPEFALALARTIVSCVEHLRSQPQDIHR